MIKILTEILIFLFGIWRDPTCEILVDIESSDPSIGKGNQNEILILKDGKN